MGDEDDEYYYQDRKQNNRRNKKKKKQQQEQQQEAQAWDWDDIYDPTRPNNYSDYKGSDEQYREHRDWKARLYYYQLKDAKKARKSEDEQRKPANSNCFAKFSGILADSRSGMFAPPSSLSFAPPSLDDNAPTQRMDVDDEDDYYRPEPQRSDESGRNATFAPPSFAPQALSDDATGDDAYMRRMRMSGMPPPAASPPTHSSPPKRVSPPAHSTPPLAVQQNETAAKIAEAQAKIAAFKAKMGKPSTPAQNDSPAAPSPKPSAEQEAPPPPPSPPEPAGTISRAPVRYEVPASQLPAEDDIEPSADTPAEDQPRSKKPGQKGFAERLMNKYGWEKGQGLGASGEGITTALIGKVDKSKGQKRSDPDGGRLPAVTMGKIVGGKRRKVEGAPDDDGRFGKMSDVIKLEGLLTGLDVQKEIEENNLMQEVGEEMGEKYGNVERVFVWREEQGGKGEVFVKFTSQLSALRAVNAMDETTFAENKVEARFFDTEKFENGEYGG